MFDQAESGRDASDKKPVETKEKLACERKETIMTALDELRQYPTVDALKPALRRLCEKFGRIARLDVLTAVHEGTRQAICFLKLDSLEKEQILMKTLGVGRFGGEIVFVLDLNVALPSEDEGPSSQWAEFQDFDVPAYQASEAVGKTRIPLNRPGFHGGQLV